MAKSTQRALLLALAGLASGLFSNATTKLGSDLGWFYPGLVFGVAIAAVFIFHGGVRAPGRLIGFVLASTVAYPIAVWSGMMMVAFGKANQKIPIPSFFVAGSVGAFIILLAALVLSGHKVTARPFYLALIGGVLGVIGVLASAGGQGAPAQDNGDTVQDQVLAVIWQTGVALSVAFVAPRE
jgi:hypothetical protein